MGFPVIDRKEHTLRSLTSSLPWRKSGTLQGFTKGWFPKGWFWRMFTGPQKSKRGYNKRNDGTKNRNEGTKNQTTVQKTRQNRPFIKPPFGFLSKIGEDCRQFWARILGVNFWGRHETLEKQGRKFCLKNSLRNLQAIFLKFTNT